MLNPNSFAISREVAEWKRRVRPAWPRVLIRSLGMPGKTAMFGDKVRFTVGVRSDELTPDDIVVELLLTPAVRELPAGKKASSHPFVYSGERGEGGEYRFTLDLAPELCGKLEYRIRAYPFHKALSHRFEMGLMKWL